jgi:hypothetical protein
MKNALRAKLIKRLRNALSPGRQLDTESLRSVLVDVRNLLEISDETEKYKVLKFHCDWVLHPKLTGSRAQRIIKAVDIECVRSMEKAGLREWPTSAGNDFFGPVSQEFMNELLGRFTFHPFESELRSFLDRHQIAGLPDPTSQTWRGFEVVYCQLIEDRTWDYTNKKEPTLYVNRVRVQMQKRPDSHDRDVPPRGQAFPLCLRWVFLWGDGERLMFEVEFLSLPHRPAA